MERKEQMQISSLRKIEAEAATSSITRITVRDAVVDSPPTYQAERVRSIREGLGLSQPLFAQALNVSVQTVRGWEQGNRLPDGSSERLLEIAEKHPDALLEAVHTSFSAEATPPKVSGSKTKQARKGTSERPAIATRSPRAYHHARPQRSADSRSTASSSSRTRFTSGCSAGSASPRSAR